MHQLHPAHVYTRSMSLCMRYYNSRSFSHVIRSWDFFQLQFASSTHWCLQRHAHSTHLNPTQHTSRSFLHTFSIMYSMTICKFHSLMLATSTQISLFKRYLVQDGCYSIPIVIILTLLILLILINFGWFTV
jgi:hypothetical protein